MIQPFALDLRAARRAFERSASSAGEVSVLAREVERRMAERLQYVRVDPARVLDAGCGAGEGIALLRARYPGAQFVGIDFAERVVRVARARAALLERIRSLFGAARDFHVCAELSCLPLASGSFGMVWSNLALAWAGEPSRALEEFHRVLEPGGLLMFSSYGPDTLKELREAFAAADAGAHAHAFADMHDVGDLLVSRGFGTPVMDMELITLTYANFDTLVHDLRRSGQVNVARNRPRGLLGRRAWHRVREAYEAMRRDGRLPATFEIVYGHGWKGVRRAEGQSVVRLDIKRRTPRT